jgi:hypothetical protein
LAQTIENAAKSFGPIEVLVLPEQASIRHEI